MQFENLPPLDIKSFVNTAALLFLVGVILSFLRGYQAIRLSQTINYYRFRHAQIIAGWRLIFLGLILALAGLWLKVYGEPVAYRFIPITATPTLTPTLTITPTITLPPTETLVPSITPTLSETYTPTTTPTPHIPLLVEVIFEAQVTPPAEVIFSPLTFSYGMNADYQPIRPDTEFENPVGHLYALFSYDKMADGVQWTALWYRENELVHHETMVWEWGSGGYGFTDWDPEPADWLPGNYYVQIFVGHEPKTVGSFVVTGIPPIPTYTPTTSIILIPTSTLAATPTPGN